jgi:hypothetical protein
VRSFGYEMNAAHCQNQMNQINTLCRRIAGLRFVKAGGAYSYHWALNLNSVNKLIFVMVKCGVLFEVRTEFLNNI